MAIRSTAASGYLVSASGLPASNGTWTMMFRFKITVDTNARVRLVTLAGTGGQTLSAVLSSADGTTFGVRTGATQADGTNLTVGTWYWGALVRNGDDSTVYLDGVQDATQTVAASWTPAGIYLFSATIDGLNGCIEGFKFWDAVLSASEIQAEMASLAPIRTANLNRWTPLVPYGSGTRNLDRSGNGHDWTENGTLTDEAGSGTPWEVAITAAAGVATTSTLTGASTAQGSATAAAGAATASTLTGASTAQAGITAADGTSTAASLTGQAVTSAAITPADGVSTAGTLSGSATAESAISAAAGTASAQALAGQSTADASITPAVGTASAQALAGASTAEASISPAAGVATGETLTGEAQEGSTITPADGSSTTETLSGSSVAEASIVPAQGQSTGETLASNGQPAPSTGGGYDYPSRRRKARVIKDDRDEREREFEALLDLVKGLGEAEAVEDVQEAEPMRVPRLPAPVAQLAVPDVRPMLARAFAEGYRRAYRAEVRRTNLEQDDEEALVALL